MLFCYHVRDYQIHMTIFLTLFYKILPLYAVILLGFIATKRLKVAKEHFGKLLIYIISPAVVFYGTATAQITLANISLPLFFFAVGCLMAFVFYQIGKILWPNNATANILAFSAGDANSGYFGLPVALVLFGESGLSMAIMAGFGFILFENSIGCYLTARGQFTPKDSLIKLLRIPTLYAFFLGIVFSILQIDLGNTIINTLNLFKGTYSILGMMIIGMNVSNIQHIDLDLKFVGLNFLAKFIVWPLLIFAFIWLDKTYLSFFNAELYPIMILMSIVPLAANTVVWATEFKVYPEKMATAVLLSTILALFFIPAVLSFINI